MVCVLMAGTIFVVERQVRKTTTNEFIKLGIAISKNLSAVNTNYITTYNYVGIEQNVAKAVKDNNLTYALIRFFDGEIAAYSGEKTIKEEVIRNSPKRENFKDENTFVRYLEFDDSSLQICELATAIIIGDKQWATVRTGLSMENIKMTIANTRNALYILGVIVLAFGCLVSILFSSKITRPVASLVNDVEAISKGDYEQDIGINSLDEIGYLAKRFGAMKESLKDNIRMLKDSNLKLSSINQRLQSLFKASQSMNSIKNQDRIYDLILDTALMATDAYGASLINAEPDSTVKVVASIIKETKNNTPDPVYKKLLEKQPFLNPMVPHDSSLGPCSINLEYIEGTPFYKTQLSNHPEIEMLSLQLGSSEELKGYINLIKDRKSQVDTVEMQTLVVLASQSTTSIENNHLFIKLEQAYLSSIKSLAKTLELKDEYTHGHAERVADLCKIIGSKMNMDKNSIKVIYNAALLHDIGKIGVLESILNKADSLTNDEFRKIKRHPIYGEDILRPIFSLREESKILRHHHEREDGRGYPDGLMGNQLSLSEKIIIVADAFDAMNSRRSYRDAMDLRTIMNELKKNRGKQFDSDVVDVFLEIYNPKLADNEKEHQVIHFPAISSSS